MRIRAVVMGLGGRGRHWTRDILASQAFELAGVVDPDGQRRERAAAETGLAADRQFADLDDACRLARPEAAVVVTPNVLHDRHVADCLDRGLHVLGEKPFVIERQNGAAILAKARGRGLTAMAVQNYRYNGAAARARQMLMDRELGEPSSALVHFSRMRPIRGMPYAMLYNQGIHLLDSIRFVLAADARTAYARSWNPRYHDCDADTSCEAVFEMDNGVVVNFSGNYSTHGPDTAYGGAWRIECALGTIHLSPFGVENTLYVSREKAPLEQVPVPEPPEGANGLMLRDFERAIREGVAPPTDAADNMRSLAMIWAIIESSRANRVVAVDAGV
jgi:predicted dehydrogenase